MGRFVLDNGKKAELLQKYGSPLYIYDESILRERCREIKKLITKYNFKVSYSAKANSNIELIKLIKDEGINVDVMSPGEIFLQEKAGYDHKNIFFVSNNISAEEMRFAIDRGILLSVDSVSQLKLYGEINRGGKVAIRFNPGVGAGHHEKVVTAGSKSKFGVEIKYLDEVKSLLREYDLKLVGINQHIGSLFLETRQYIDAAKNLLKLAKEFEALEFIDFGGGFGIPYNGEERLDLVKLSGQLHEIIDEFIKDYDNKEICFKVEPGRYLVAECGILLGKVYSVKENYGEKYIGTDLGFNVFMRQVLYNAKHGIAVLQEKPEDNEHEEKVTIVGNICESGDIIAKDILLPKISEGDIIELENAGAYGYAMSSNYNGRLRPAELLIDVNGEFRLIRKRDTFEDLVRGFLL